LTLNICKVAARLATRPPPMGHGVRVTVGVLVGAGRVQTILGHKWVTTTLGYARLYDGTVAADYYRAMGLVEKQLPLVGDAVLMNRVEAQPNAGRLLALVDSLRGGTLNEAQAETVGLLRAGILALAEKSESMELLKGK
jgi:hypothetical protein